MLALVEPPAIVTQAEVTHDLDAYYAGEGLSADVVTGIGSFCALGGIGLVTRDGDFARGLGWPLLILGTLEGVGAVFYRYQVADETRHYHAALAANAKSFREEELAHMRGTTRRFVFYQATELALTLTGTGVAIYGFAADKDAVKGVGLGLAAIGLPFLVIDAINQGRATRYRDAVDRFDPSLPETGTRASALAPARPTPWMLSYGVSF